MVEFILRVPLALFAVFISWYLPGALWMRKLQLRSAGEHVVLSSVLGFVLWGLQGYMFGYLGLRQLTYLYVLGTFLFSYPHIMEEVQRWKSVVLGIMRADRLLLILCGVGLVGQLLAVLPSGLKYADGIRFYQLNAFDGVMHLSYIQEISKRFPPQEPGAAGLPLINYHYWSNLVLGEMVRIWHLPPTMLYFQLLPLFIGPLIIASIMIIMELWGGGVRAKRWAAFFWFFGGNAVYLFVLFFHRRLDFTTAAIDNGMLQFLNMPAAPAKMIFLASLIPLWRWFRTKRLSLGLLAAVLMSSLTGFKVYFGLFAALGLVFLTIFLFRI